MKGYKITQHGCLCDGCYPLYVRTTVYEYGCGSEYHGGYDGVELAVQQMRLANQLWNALVEIDRFERTEFRRLTTDPTLDLEIKTNEQVKEDLYTIVKAQKQKERSKRAKIDPAITEQLKQVRADLKTLYALNKEQAANLRVVNASELEFLKKDVAARIDAATEPSTCGLSWTMIEPLKARFTTASKRAKKDGTMLKFHRFDGSGSITVPFTNGLSLAQAYRSDEVGKFQIASSLMSSHPREKRTAVRVAVTSIDKKPVWLTVPVVFDRPLPAESDIRHVTVRREILGGKPRWKVCITARVSTNRTSNTLACGLDIGWRKRPDGSIRVAYLVDETGYREELCLSAGFMAQFRKLDDLRSIMDDKFNDVRDELSAMLKGLAVVPEETQELFKTIGQWRSPGRLIHAMKTWKDHRFDGDREMWDAAQYWLHGARVKPDPVWNGHLHLYQWWVNLADQLQRSRREQYRVFASMLGKKYGRVFLEEFDLRSVIETPSPDRDQSHDKEARYQRTKAAVSCLRSAIENVCAREGVTLEKVDAVATTHDCPTCGSSIEFDAAVNLMCRCEYCGTLNDQDYIGAKNVLDRGIFVDERAIA